jgi:hypothetical protein
VAEDEPIVGDFSEFIRARAKVRQAMQLFDECLAKAELPPGWWPYFREENPVEEKRGGRP